MRNTGEIKLSGLSQNIAWTVHKGAMVAHSLIIFLGYLILRSLLNSNNTALMVTPLFYNITTLIFFHLIVGDPFDSNYGALSFWEQMVEQIGYRSTTMFFMVCPIGLFFIINHLVEWNIIMYVLNIISLIIVVIAKCGFMHRRRVFGIGRNK
ncbi:putative membrane protein [Pseudoloma neurophilia]|uniref:Putative membrane protein n=1 Tax=Pseudoloma neurophilia TaxID=146866 RepID=A0A0R0LZB4_9MICR|nr:putative membrane protein [Pseudoloma neurophilia]